MANFFQPRDEPAELYGNTTEGGYAHPWKITVKAGGSGRIGLWGGYDREMPLVISSNNPGIIDWDEAPVTPAGGDRFIRIMGRVPGFTILDASSGHAVWCSIQVEVVAGGPGQPNRGGPNFVLARMDVFAEEFSAGFADGLAANIDLSIGQVIKDKILADKFGFYRNYLYGELTGLIGGLKSLWETLVSLIDVAVDTSPPAMVIWIARETYLNLTSAAHRKLRVMQATKAKRVAEAIAAIIVEIQHNPSLYLAKTRTGGYVLGAALAAEVKADAREKSASELGELFGKIIGRVLFEIIFMIVLAMATGGAGDAARAGAAIGEAATEGGTALSRLIAKLSEVLEGLPAIRRLIIELLEEKVAAGATDVVGREIFAIARDVAVKSELSAAEKASALEGIFREISAADASWQANRGPVLGAEAFFTGDARPFGLIVDSQGAVWQTKNIAEGGKFVMDGGQLKYLPDFSKWILVK
jgi:hypothetical protein